MEAPVSDEETKDGPRSSLRGFARRILREGEDDERRIDPRELVGAMLDTGDKAKTEIVKLVAREVRGYLEALELHKDLRHILTNYSLDFHTNLSLRPLSESGDQGDEGEGPSISLRLRPDKPAEE